MVRIDRNRYSPVCVCGCARIAQSLLIFLLRIILYCYYEWVVRTIIGNYDSCAAVVIYGICYVYLAVCATHLAVISDPVERGGGGVVVFSLLLLLLLL